MLIPSPQGIESSRSSPFPPQKFVGSSLPPLRRVIGGGDWGESYHWPNAAGGLTAKSPGGPERSNLPLHRTAYLILAIGLLCFLPRASAQSVCLPAPRLLTTFPMGAQVGTEVEVKISGQHHRNRQRTWLFAYPALRLAKKSTPMACGKPIHTWSRSRPTAPLASMRRT